MELDVQTTLREPPALLGQLQTEIQGLQSLLGETRVALLTKPKLPPVGPDAEQAATTAAPTGTDDGATSSGRQRQPSDGILAFAEDIHELAWTLQARDVDVEACERLAKSASQIYALSLRQAIEAQRIQQLTTALDGALARLDGLLETIGHEMQYEEFSPLPEELLQSIGARSAAEAGSLGANSADASKLDGHAVPEPMSSKDAAE